MHRSWQDLPEDPLISQHEIRENVVTELMSLVCIVSSVQGNSMCGTPCSQKIASKQKLSQKEELPWKGDKHMAKRRKRLTKKVQQNPC